MVHIDTAIAQTLLTQVTDFKNSLLSQFNIVLPLALAVVITITVVTMAIAWFKHITGLSH